MFLHACHELSRGAVSWYIDTGGKEIIAAVCIVLTEAVVAASVTIYHWFRTRSKNG